MKKAVLVTGSAGFIGFHLSKYLISKGIFVIGLDNLNSYYDRNLKLARLGILKDVSKKDMNFEFVEDDLVNREGLNKLFDIYKPSIVINLAAQAGVRYSIENPIAYIDSNIVGFANILECCRHSNVQHLLYASSSSVYGGNEKIPFSEKDSVDHPMSLYAASKKANELMAHTYSNLYGLPTTGLRFFTVYGPWGRPDMALFLFTKAILSDEPIQIFNHGEMTRDFTYIDDIVESLFLLLDKPPSPDPMFDKEFPEPHKSWCPYRIFNIGNSNPVPLMDYISALEQSLGKKATKKFLPMQPGDVPMTAAETNELESYINFRPKTSISDGIKKFVSWYLEFYKAI
ncbi:NAD-dependent epimerase [Prochlorococcus marinus]|uniref:NAD-dependent epimerase n=1 Tax=Prochlorococcus marinus TaxID=1219 RepID=UPI0022B49CE0|nr:NAD-dependent epimerase [Prochlorococcus marinus]